MIQIIGFLICACLAVKLFEMTANPAMRQEDGDLRIFAMFGLIVGWFSVVGFAFWLMAQGDAFPNTQLPDTYAPALTQEQIECIEKNAGNTEAVLACAP